MQADIEHQVENVIHYRRRLAEVEARRSQHQQDVPSEIWQELAEVSHCLEQAEGKVRQICQVLAGDVNQTRLEIVSSLDEYNHWREQMRQVEDLFLASIVRPGRHLKQAIRQREFLEQEYRRIQVAIQRAGYTSQEELEADIRRVLVRGEVEFDSQAELPDEDEMHEDEDSFEQVDRLDVDDVLEALSKEELVKEFKRIVLPAVHPDTSNTPPEVFKTVYEVYKSGDHLLMEAYIVEYRGEIKPDKELDPLESLDRVGEIQDRYQRLSAHLQRRVDRLKEGLTSQELEHPGQVQEDLARQRQEILDRIKSEAEQILTWRARIEGLVQDYQERQGQAGENK